MDKQLNQLLDSYAVEDADTALLDRIVERAQATHGSPPVVSLPAYRPLMAAMMAACAVLGFWMGNATLVVEAQTAQNPAGAVSLDSVILGPNSFSEVML